MALQESDNMISTIHSANIKKDIQKYGYRKIKPECTADYKKYMNGMDNVDQYLALYPVIRKTVKWPKKLFVHSLQCTLVNTFLLFCKSTFLQFM
jgi:hypothetical protein